MLDLKHLTDLAIARVRLFFPLPEEESIAVELTRFFVAQGGRALVDLRPDMTMGEVLELAQDYLWTTREFEYMLELSGIEAFDDQLEP